MKRMMKIELRRAFTSPGCVLALILGCLIAAVHWALFVLPLSSTLEDYVEMNKAMMYPGWLYTSWIGSDTTAIPAYLLFLILPIMAVLPHADTFFTDAGSGFIQNICIRTSHKNYYIAKYTATLSFRRCGHRCPLPAQFPPELPGTAGHASGTSRLYQFHRGSMHLPAPFL